MSKPQIYMPSPMMDYVTERLDAAFNVHKAWVDKAGDINFGDIRAIASGPHADIDAALIDRFPNLEIIANFGVGYDAVDAVHAARRRVIVTNTPNVLTQEVADTAMGLLLMTARQLSASERYLRDGKWANQGEFPLTPATLRGRSLGIIGLGRIGKAIATRARSFGMGISYTGRNRQEGVEYQYYGSPLALAEAVDTLMVVAPGGEATRHMVNAQILAALGRDGILINIGRGSVVDEKALIAALEQGTIHSAGLDVFEDEPNVPAALIAMERVVLLPHVGSASVATRNAMGQLVVDNLQSWFEHRKPLTPVDETPFSSA